MQNQGKKKQVNYFIQEKSGENNIKSTVLKSKRQIINKNQYDCCGMWSLLLID